MVESNIYEEAVKVFGAKHQHIVAMGEFAECTAELAKMFISNREPDEEAIIDELADVQIMMSQMKVIYGDRLTQAIHKKLNKLRGHINAQ